MVINTDKKIVVLFNGDILDFYSFCMEWEYFGFTEVEDEKIIDQNRWTTRKSQIIKEDNTENYYQIIWEVGSTEMVDIDISDVYSNIVRVFPKEIVQTVYVEAE